jgi:hypothetical protein
MFPVWSELENTGVDLWGKLMDQSPVLLDLWDIYVDIAFRQIGYVMFLEGSELGHTLFGSINLLVVAEATSVENITQEPGIRGEG